MRRALKLTILSLVWARRWNKKKKRKQVRRCTKNSAAIYINQAGNFLLRRNNICFAWCNNNSMNVVHMVKAKQIPFILFLQNTFKVTSANYFHE